MSALKALLPDLTAGKPLPPEAARAAFAAIMAGEEPQPAIAAFLTALRMRGETVDEIVAAAQTMRAHALNVSAPPDAIDMCGTGGDGAHTLNISTAATFVVAGLGVPVAKHGNRAQSSRTGAADVLEALGVKIGLTPDAASACLAEAGSVFLFAQTHHPAMRHVAPVRAALGFRTIFNLLGPLSSPAGVTRQLIGVFAPQWVEPVAEALRRLGCERAMVVHGSDGLDEITTTGPTEAAFLSGGKIERIMISPEHVAIRLANPADLKGGDAAFNAAALRDVLDGALNPYRDIVCLNAAAALLVAGKVKDLNEGVALARASLDQGLTKAALDRLVAVSQRVAS
jgi:anthranilate phosphoribosyltransferase